MFENLLSYYGNNAQVRINERIEKINNQRKSLRSSPDKKYKDLKSIKNTHLYINKPKIIKDIREKKVDEATKLLSVTIGQSLIDNLKLKPDISTYSSDKYHELKMKKDNLEFTSLQELFWGLPDRTFSEKDKFYFLLNLFLDLLNNKDYVKTIHNILIEYVPFAHYAALEKVSRDDSGGFSISKDYKSENVDVFSESVFLFCSTENSDEIMERFIDYLYGEYKYESKDKQGRFLVKTEVICFQNFEKSFSEKLKDILAPVLGLEDYDSLGKRVYDIVIDDFKINSNLIKLDMERSMESYGHWLTKGEKNDIDVLDDLIDASETYIERLVKVQIDQYGDIEKDYFESPFFSKNSSPCFSEDRMIELVKEKQEGEYLDYQESVEESESMNDWEEHLAYLNFLDEIEEVHKG